MKAATPPFASKDPAADEVVEEETEVVGEAGEARRWYGHLPWGW